MLATEVAAAGVNASSVVFEFTRTTVADGGTGPGVVHDLRAAGFGVALDDSALGSRP